MRRLLFLLAALATACSGADAVAVRQRSVGLDAVIVGEEGDAGRQLTLFFIGGRPGLLEDDPCAGEHEVEVAESDDEITVTVFVLALVDGEETTCTMGGHFRQLDVEFDQPIGDRSVIDGHDDSQLWVIDPAAVLWPQSLPVGWIVRSRSAGDGGLISSYGDATTSDGSIGLVAVPADAESKQSLAAAMNEPDTTVREMTIRGSASAVGIASEESGRVTIAFEEDGLQYRVIAYGEDAIEELESFVSGLERDPTSRSFEIPFEASIERDPNEGNVIPTPTATLPEGLDPPAPTPIGAMSDDPPGPELAWIASESTRDVANYLQALREGAYEQAAWPAANNGVEFDRQTRDETGAEYLERSCGVDLCQGPYLVRGEPGYFNPTTSQVQPDDIASHGCGLGHAPWLRRRNHDDAVRVRRTAHDHIAAAAGAKRERRVAS